MEVLIRPFRAGDLDALFVLDYRCYAAPYRFGYQQLLRTLQDRNVSAIVIEGEAQDRLIGGLIVRSDPARKQITVISLMVESDYRRLGLARRLVAWAEGLARSNQWEAIVVPLERGNEAGAAFLNATGFFESEDSDPYFASHEEGALWRLPLNDEGDP